MKLEVAIIERKEQLDDLIPFRVENALWGTEKFPPMYGYIGFIPQDAFYLKLICEEKNPLRVYTEINDPIYRDSVMEAYLMFEPVSSRANEENYLNFAVNANGVLHAEYGSRRGTVLILQRRNGWDLNVMQKCMKMTGRQN